MIPRSAAPYLLLDPCLPPADADRLLDLVRDVGPYEVYVGAPIATGIGAGLVRRQDALMNYVRQQFAAGRVESMEHVAARTNLFRRVLAEGSAVHVRAAEELLYGHAPFLHAARQLTGLPLVVPDMLYVNLLLPGQELAVHSDTPEYRGISKATVPEWFCVVMLHSGLFEEWRVRIAGGVTFLRPPDAGGSFLLYAHGAQGRCERVVPRHNTSVMLDADALFHGVERVGGPDAPPPPVRPGMTLQSVDDGTWELRDGERVIASYRWGEVRLSIQWKAHCFADEAARERFRSHADDLSVEQAVERLLADLRAKGRVGAERPQDSALPFLLMDTYVGFPAATDLGSPGS